MAKTRTMLSCAACGQPASQWVGRCPSCGAWGTIEEAARATAGAVAVAQLSASPEDEPRIASGFGGVDRVLGGGVVRGSVVLVAGEPGIGKSTLLLQIAAKVGTAERPALYASGEESQGQVASRARRLGVPADRISFVAGRDVHEVLDAGSSVRPPLLVVDSIQ
ncbi:MAG TPA: ATPase domain-containing protein, partial [Actinomycetota bacterium]|nr:ATPase domain-containing protein [Actinomycetota bacterium]